MRWVPLLAFAVACANKTAPVETPPSSAAPSSTTRWVKVRSAVDLALFEAPARVLAAPHGTAAMAPPLRARVLRVRVRAGQRVAVGEALLDVMMPEVVQAAGAFSAALLKQEAYAIRHTQLESLKAEGLVRAIDLAEVDSLLATARADGQAARATLRAAGVSDKAAEALLFSDGAVPLRAPIAGVVTAVDAIPGEVREPSGRALVELVGEGEGQVEARLSAETVPGASFDFIGAGGLPVPLVLVSSSPRVETSDGSRLAWLRAEGAVLPVGASGRVRMRGQAGWCAVPARAVLGAGPTAQVCLRTAAGSALVSIRVIALSGAEAVVEGLSPDAEVAADGSEMKR